MIYLNNKGYDMLTVAVSSGSSGVNIDTKTVTPSANATSVQITGLSGQPTWFYLIPNAAISAMSGARRVIGHVFNGTADTGLALISSGSSWSVTYSVDRNTTNFSHTYSNGTLTLNSGSTTTGGGYQNVQYTLVYGY